MTDYLRLMTITVIKDALSLSVNYRQVPRSAVIVNVGHSDEMDIIDSSGLIDFRIRIIHIPLAYM